MSNEFIRARQRAHIEKFYNTLPEQARADVDAMVKIWVEQGRAAAEKAYGGIIVERGLKLWEAVALGNCIRVRAEATAGGAA